MRKAVTVLAIIFLVLFLLIGGVFWALETPAGQNFLTKQATAYLRKKLDTRIDIKAIRLSIPDWVALEGVYIEDKAGDTLVAGDRLYVNIDMFSLIKGNIGINEIEAEGLRANVSRTLPDTVFNYQFIVDAFASKEPVPEDTAFAPLDMRLDKISLKRVHVSYQDVVSGTDAEIRIPSGEVLFSAFNPSYSRYHPQRTVLTGVRANLKMYAPLVAATPSSSTATAQNVADTLDVNVGDVDIRDFGLTFVDDVLGLSSAVQLGRLNGKLEQVFVNSQQITVNTVNLEKTSATVEFAKRAKVVSKNEPSTSGEASPGEASPGWTIRVGSLKLTDVNAAYDDQNEAKIPRGMDYAHLGITGLTADLTNFIFSTDSIAGSLERAAFREKSGFVLQQAKADFAYASTQTYLRNFYLKTPSTVLQDELVLRYKNQEQLTEQLGQVGVSVRLKSSQLAFRDVLLLVPDLKDTPPFSKNPEGVLKGDALITGTVNNLQIKQANFSTLDGTILRTTGRIRGLPDTDRLAMEIDLGEFSTTRQDLMKILPDSSLPSSIELPERLALRGKLNGTLEDLTMDAVIETSLGNASFDGAIKNATDSVRAMYNGQLSLEEFDLGKFLKQPPEELGKLSLRADVDGQGYDPKTMQTRINGTVQSASVKGYTYQDLNLTGTLENGRGDFKAGITDPNVDLALNAQVDLNPEFPTVTASGTIQKLDLKALNLYAEELSLSGAIDANMTSTDPANPLGTVSIRDLVMTTTGEPVRIDSAVVELSSENSIKTARVESPFLKATVAGTFDYEHLGDIVLSELNTYFTLPDSLFAPAPTPYELSVDIRLANHPLIQQFVPALMRMDTVRLNARIDSDADSSLLATLSVPLLEYDSIRTDNARLNLVGLGQEATVSGQVEKVESAAFRVRNASIDGTVANNTALLTLLVRDSVDNPQHTVGMRLAQVDNAYRFSLRDPLELDYRIWQTDSAGYVQYSPAGILIQNFGINREGQSILVQSQTEQPNGPLKISVDSVGIGQFIALVTRDSTLADGKLDGDIELRNYMETPSFTGDLHIKNLTVTNIPIGDVNLDATNEKANRISLDVNLISDLNDLKLTGDYITNGETSLDFDLDIAKLSARTIEAFSFGELRNARGNLTGKTSLDGTAESPILNGALRFDSVAFDVTQLGARYRLNDQAITFDRQRILFNSFTIQDTLNQKLEINGNVSIATLPDVGYDLSMRANDFTVLNASRKDNDYFYGKGIIDMVLNVKGKGAESIIDGTIKLRPGSDITVLLPDDAQGAGSTEGIVQFVDMSDSSAVATVDSSDIESSLRVDFASELSLNIEADDESQLTIVIDELNGDNIKVKGNAQLNAGIAPNGQLYLLGLYELTEGSYDLTFEVLKKQFTIQKGSQILWTGDPLEAQVDITAVYAVNADLVALDATQTDLGKIPLNVLLKINGNLSSPVVSFDIEVSERLGEDDAQRVERSNVLTNLRNNTAELNKQVFALLVLNRFITDQTTGSSTSGVSAEAIARQSVSQLLSDQLNLLASDLIKGVNVNFNLNSTAEGSAARTDLNVGLSKAFLNDRLTVSVGRNFELENSNGSDASSTELFDNVAVNYALTKDGRYLFRAYRKNQYQAVLQGFIVETGLSFIVTLDYDKFRELFQKEVE
ncbi:translocation/assembly module TamB domain-containing protein [Arundinibacter roseus]|uniref:Translocation/assembly module TamB n=1 Tax=Arundinibacter roseus TaxID=2070510 RepID=A0A4V2X8I2_9BACT|nr:translocation/assembly module TamB domain-containing protein [Arundinibacter roseus]TDB60045.1 translocation/assembly module TamB [Arundinibacter roseus]